MDGLTFLQNPAQKSPQTLYVVTGDEAFLKRHVLAALREQLLGEGENPFGWSVLSGDRATWSAIHGELTTLPFLGPRRVVVVDGADPFVTACREKLEKYLAAPAATGVLVLDVKSWPATTRLAKTVPDKATLTCKAPASQRLPEWCRQWCLATHGKALAAGAAKLLVDLVGADMGLLDQEMGKLAVYAEGAKQIEAADVDRLVGNSREENVWKIFDLIGTGQAAAALTVLDRLLAQGEDPLRLLGAFSMKLRGMAQAYRLTTVGRSLSQAMDEAGIPTYPIARQSAEQQMRHLGGRRLNRVYDWLLQANLGMKGGSQLPPRTLMERLVIQLARK
jgi:DNA polymerase-3 subunit delta